MNNDNVIPITDTPYVSSLSKDFLLNKNIGINNPVVTNYSDLIKKAENREFSDLKRKNLIKILYSQYKNDHVLLSPDSKAYKNISALSDPNTFTFTTGQQLHIFLGPLFMVTKIKSLLRHVNNFNTISQTLKALPVFWMAAEDHDLDEINFVKLYGQKYTWNAQSGNAVGRMFCDGLEALIETLEKRADKTEENSNFYKLLKKHYKNHKTLAAATRGVLNELFEKEGLIIINPDDDELKKEFKKIAKQEIANKVIFNTYNDQNKLLKNAGYESRVNAQQINYFWLNNNIREKLIIKNDKIFKGNSDEELSINTIENQIEKLSPNVISRPIYQETILPNIMYLAGSAEIDYWLPLQKAFSNLNLPFPAIMVRDSQILIPKSNLDFLEKVGMKWNELFNTDKKVAEIFNKTFTKPKEVKAKIEEIGLDLESINKLINEIGIKSSLMFKELSELRKNLKRFNLFYEEALLIVQKDDAILKKIFKIKEKYFDLKQERDVFVIENQSILSHSAYQHSEFEGVIILKKM